jgi:hypothetical protein
MTLLHVSVPAANPEQTAHILARILGGACLPFPPCPDAWIAFAASDDGTAIEVYPDTAVIEQGPQTIAFANGSAATQPIAMHVAVASPLPLDTIMAVAAETGWTARVCDRGPFECVELWINDRYLIEVLDPKMLRDYRKTMTARNWRDIFGITETTTGRDT